MRTTVPLLICAMFLRLWAQTTLSGNIGGMTLEQSGNPYLVTESITVQSGKTTTVKPGCIFLFKPFTDLDVQGSLIVAGTRDTPVVFTSANDINYNKTSEQVPNPFDWNGIIIGKDAKNIRLSNFMLAYSVYGIKSMQDGVSIENGVFLQNGQFHFTINETIQPVHEGIPFNYGKNSKKKNDGKSFVNKHLTATIATTGAACGVGAVVSAVVFQTARSGYATETDPDQQKHYRATITTSLVSTVFFGAAAAALVPSAIIIHHRRKTADKKASLEIIPQFRDGPAIAVLVRF